jgi:hypothetical protein
MSAYDGNLKPVRAFCKDRVSVRDGATQLRRPYAAATARTGTPPTCPSACSIGTAGLNR